MNRDALHISRFAKRIGCPTSGYWFKSRGGWEWSPSSSLSSSDPPKESLPPETSPAWTDDRIIPRFAGPTSLEQQSQLARLWHNWRLRRCARAALKYQADLRVALGHQIHRGPSQSLTACNLQMSWLQLCSNEERESAEKQLEGYVAQAATDLRKIYQEYLAAPLPFERLCSLRWGIDWSLFERKWTSRRLAREFLLACSLVDPDLQVIQRRRSLICQYSAPKSAAQQPLRSLILWFKACRYRVAVREQSSTYFWT